MASHPVRSFFMAVDGLAVGTVTTLVGLGVGAADHHVALTAGIAAAVGVAAGAGGTYVVANKINRAGRNIASNLPKALENVERALGEHAPAKGQGVE